MTTRELMAAVVTLREIEAAVSAMRGGFLVGGDVAIARKLHDARLLIADLICEVEREIAKQGSPELHEGRVGKQ